MAASLLMPKATAVWLIDNTALTFDQVAAFCALHPLEVQGIADGDVAGGVKGINPIQNGQLTRAEIEKAEADPAFRMELLEPKVRVPEIRRRGPRYTPVSKRQEKPNAILWLARNHPELKDAQIMRLVGTTKPTIESVRERTHWNASNQAPLDPVTIGLCTQTDLDFEVRRAAASSAPVEEPHHEIGLLTAEEAMARAEPAPAEPDLLSTPTAPDQSPEVFDAEAVFAKLKQPAAPKPEDDEPEKEVPADGELTDKAPETGTESDANTP
jgi:uncharacterized protein